VENIRFVQIFQLFRHSFASTVLHEHVSAVADGAGGIF
jgi:hypothetical protein